MAFLPRYPMSETLQDMTTKVKKHIAFSRVGMSRCV
jgi:hypothetical protein